MARERNLTSSSSEEVVLLEGMQSLVSLEGYSPDLRKYLEGHKWPSLMEVWYWELYWECIFWLLERILLHFLMHIHVLMLHRKFELILIKIGFFTNF